MTRSHRNPRLTAYALGELDAEEQHQFEATLADDAAARRELADIGRVAALVKRELAEPTGIRLSAQQIEQLEGVWRARSAGAGMAGAPGEAPSPFAGGAAGPTLLEDFARPPGNRSARRRFAKALLAAALLHTAAAAALVVFPSTARELVEEPWGAVAFRARLSPERPMLAEIREAPPKPVTPPTQLDGATVPPEYSIVAPRDGLEGRVIVTFDVLEDGTVANIKPISGPPELFESAVKAVGSWRFRPAHRGGQPVRYSLTTAVTFRLEAL